jgi:universal stress protein A
MKKDGVICAIDVNDFDPNVINLAAQFARHHGVDLDLVHVSVYPDPRTSAWPSYVGAKSALDIEQEKLRTIASEVSLVDAHPHHLAGIPTDELIGFANRNQPRLLVIGTHGRTGLQRVFGSVASKVLRHVDCPVLVLRQKQSNAASTTSTQS